MWFRSYVEHFYALMTQHRPQSHCLNQGFSIYFKLCTPCQKSCCTPYYRILGKWACRFTRLAFCVPPKGFAYHRLRTPILEQKKYDKSVYSFDIEYICTGWTAHGKTVTNVDLCWLPVETLCIGENHTGCAECPPQNWLDLDRHR